MRSSLVVLCVALVSSVLLIGANAQECTHATCPDAPVAAYFPTGNCTGEPLFYVAYNPDTLNVCQDSGPTQSSIIRTSSDGVTQFYFINNGVCDTGRANSTFNFAGSKYGVCNQQPSKKRGGSVFGLHDDVHATRAAELGLADDYSMMLLPNANASYTSPQIFNLSNPTNLTNVMEVGSASESCYSPNNCTRDDGTTAFLYLSFYEEAGNCSSAVESQMFPDIVTGQCYWYPGAGYTKLSCISTESYELQIFNDPDCRNQYSVQGVRYTCLSTSGNVAAFCSSPVSPVNPPSAASSLAFAPLLAALLAILSLLTL